MNAVFGFLMSMAIVFAISMNKAVINSALEFQLSLALVFCFTSACCFWEDGK